MTNPLRTLTRWFTARRKLIAQLECLERELCVAKKALTNSAEAQQRCSAKAQSKATHPQRPVGHHE